MLFTVHPLAVVKSMWQWVVNSTAAICVYVHRDIYQVSTSPSMIFIMQKKNTTQLHLTNLKPSCCGSGIQWAKVDTKLFFDCIRPPEHLVNVS